jgi:hypothetical protein
MVLIDIDLFKTYVLFEFLRRAKIKSRSCLVGDNDLKGNLFAS